MKAKTKKEVVDTTVDVTATETNATIAVPEPVVKIEPFVENLGREDLNQLAQKINEVIKFINK